MLKNRRILRQPVAAVLLCFMCAVMLPAAAFSAINYVSQISTSSTSANASLIFSTSTSNARVLIFTATIMDGREETRISSVSYGTQSFSLVTRTASGLGLDTGMSAEIWVLENPLNGSRAVAVTQVLGARKVMGVTEYSGVSGLGAAAAQSGDANSLTAVITTQQQRSFIAGIYGQRNSPQSPTFTPITAGLVERWNLQTKTANRYIRGLQHDRPTIAAGSYSVEYSSNRTNHSAIVETELKSAAPFVVSCSPAVGYIGGGNTVTITGSNFDDGAIVTVGGAPASVTYLSPASLRITTPAGTAGPADIVVTNLDTQTGTGAGIFTYSPYMTPLVSSVSPNTGTTPGGQDITVTGSNFVNGCAVMIGSYPAADVVFINSSTLTMKTPASAAGLFSVTVTNTVDGQFAVLPDAFTYTLPPPEVQYCLPESGHVTGGQAITIKGRYFANGATATIGGNAVTGIVFMDTATLRGIVPAGIAGPADVTVRNPDTKTGTLTGGFTYFGFMPPVLLSASPASGPTTGGQTITLSGTGFIDGATVEIGGTPASVSFISSTTLTAITPLHSSGTVGIRVINPDTQSSLLDYSYTYAAPPSIASVSPLSGLTAGGQAITIDGANFRIDCSVRIDGTPAAITRVSTAQILATTPPHSEGYAVIRVDNIDYTSGTLSPGFYYDGTAPVISLNGGGEDVTIAAGSVYTEAASTSDNFDGDITTRTARVIVNGLGQPVANVTTASIQIFTITYNVSDTAGNAALQKTRIVRVTDQTAPVIALNGGGADVTLTLGGTYTEAATAGDNIDGNITSSIVRVVRDELGTVVADVSTAAAQVFTITYDVTDAAGNPAVQRTRLVRVVALNLTGIEITTLPDKLKFKTGEPLDIDGMVVTGTYDDASTGVLSVLLSDVSGFDSSSAAAGQELTVTLGGFTDTYQVDIIELSSISVIELPDKTVYDINEPLVTDGLEVQALYSDSSVETVDISLLLLSGFDSSAAQINQAVTVSFGGRSDTFTVDIVPSLISIAITSMPLKLVYDIGDTLDITGLVVTGVYSDFSTAPVPVTAGDIAGFDTSAAYEGQVLIISYGGQTTFYTIDVVPTLASIAITKPALKLVYNAGESLDITGMVVTGTYTDGNTKTESITTANVTGFNSSVPVTGQVLTVTVNGRTAAYTIDIVQPLLVSIAITQPASKLVYEIGDELDITGLVVTGTYDDLSTKVLPVTGSNISGFNSSTPAASQLLTITYEGRTTSYTIAILNPAPAPDYCEPSFGPVSGGTAITLYGDYFVSGCTVRIGGNNVTSLVFVDEGTLTMTTPPGVAGLADITVTNPDGRIGTALAAFNYTGPTPTPTRTHTSSPTSTRTPSPTVTQSSTNTPDYTATATSTITLTHTASDTPTLTNTATVTDTHTVTATNTSTATITQTSTATPTATVTNTFTASPTFTDTATITQTRTVTPTFTATPTVTITVTATPGYGSIGAGTSRVFPQPAADIIFIEYGLEETADVTVIIFNAGAVKITEKTDVLRPQGSVLMNVDVSRFAPGVYYYLLRAKTASGGEVKFPAGKFLVAR